MGQSNKHFITFYYRTEGFLSDNNLHSTECLNKEDFLQLLSFWEKQSGYTTKFIPVE